jgi:hypothetical protein
VKTRVFTLCIVASALAFPAAANAYSGSIDGGDDMNATWTQGTATFHVTYSECAVSTQPCTWNGVAGVLPAAFNCPQDPFHPGDVPFGLRWASANQVADGTIDSETRPISTNGAPGQRLCLYLMRTFSPGGYGYYLLAQKVMTQPPTPAPSTPAPPVPTPPVPTPPAQAPQQLPSTSPATTVKPKAKPTSIKSCGRVKLTGAPATFKVYMKTRYLACGTAIRIASRTLFSQSTKPADGYKCTIPPSSTRGRCKKGSHSFAYATSRARIPKL